MVTVLLFSITEHWTLDTLKGKEVYLVYSSGDSGAWQEYWVCSGKGLIVGGWYRIVEVSGRGRDYVA